MYQLAPQRRKYPTKKLFAILSGPTTFQMFLTPDALFVLVVDVFAYSEDSREDALEQWLDILQSRVPGSVVLLVGTHGDSFDSPDKRRRRVERLMEGECSNQAWTFFFFSTAAV